ncbi:uncharacterized protein LOC117913455 [Vitis riparia]|uniref:uncharacterized protein LOC117913455 n=1 Tax=Vitis riparia TaxID=96939 RepID=UPI00155ACAE3|nr:uncharacterized protein LOC117913455 [Vitis riparia]
MGIRFPSMVQAKKILKLKSLLYRNWAEVPKGHFAVYVGEVEKNRYAVPISYLDHPSFRSLLCRAKEEFGFNHPMGGLTIPCKEKAFLDLTSQLEASSKNIMGIRLPSMVQAKQILKLQSLHCRNRTEVPKGHFAVYVGEVQKKRYVVPISYLNHPSFRSLLCQAEEEFGFTHPMGGLTIPCKEDAFLDLTSQLNAS